MDKENKNLFLPLTYIIIGFFCWQSIYANPGLKSEPATIQGPTKVGNGDNGTDLEGFERVTTGSLVKSRDKAIEVLNRLQVNGIRSLGNLIPELKSSEIYITKKDVSDKELFELGAFETDRRGYVYARTFARPHAATRFFPIANSLSEDQLIALHIHEALHRALPSPTNTNESIVEKITLAIAGPDASNDLVRESIDKYIPIPSATDNLNASSTDIYINGDQINRNIFEYKFTTYDLGDSIDKKIGSSHELSSKLYPLGGKMSGTGLGLKLRWIKNDTENELGPLGISLQHQVNTITKFKVFAFIEANISPGSSKFRDSDFGRDITKLGIKMYSFKNRNINLINSLSISLPSVAKDSLVSPEVEYQYGAVYDANITLRGTYKGFGFGGFVDYAIAEQLKTVSGNFTAIEERTSIASLGAEAGYFGENYAIQLFSKRIISSNSADYGRLGDIASFGSGKANVGLGVSLLW